MYCQQKKNDLKEACDNLQYCLRRYNELRKEHDDLESELELYKKKLKQAKEAIEKLEKFKREIVDKYEEYANHREKILKAEELLDETYEKFSETYRRCFINIGDCISSALEAIKCGENICRYLDPENNLRNHSNCLVSFSNPSILHNLSNNLYNQSANFYNVENDMYDKLAVHSHTLRDQVMSNAISLINSTMHNLSEQFYSIKNKAECCKKAAEELDKYCDLYGKK